MVNDTPFVPLPSPPVDPTQTTKEADVRGYDRDDEHEKALAYKAHLARMAKGRKAMLLKLAGNKVAARNLHRKTQALTNAPPYVEAD